MIRTLASTIGSGFSLGAVFALPVALITACTSPEVPTGAVAALVDEPVIVAAPSPLPTTLQIALDDLELRVLPALDAETRATLDEVVGVLRDAITRGDVRTIRAASAVLRSRAQQLSAGDRGAAAVDLSVVDLVTTAVDAELVAAPIRDPR
jgi:hypothetical protein